MQASAGTAAEHEAAKRSGYVQQSVTARAAPLREFWLQRVKVPVAFFRGGRAPEGAEDGVGRFGRCVCNAFICVSVVRVCNAVGVSPQSRFLVLSVGCGASR